MSDKMVADYFQIGDPVDSYVAGDDKQLVDLDEYYKTQDQDNATVMVQGAEELSTGKLSKRVASIMKLKNLGEYDPFPSQRNARMGAEGFFSTIAEKFKEFIETIIRYIKMAVNWVVDSVKSFFGFKKSERENKVINDSLGDLKEEFVKVISGLGLDPNYYNVENFIGELPADKGRIPQMTILRSKFDSDEGSIKSLGEVLPIFQKCVAKLNQSSEKVVKVSNSLKKIINDEYNRTRVRQATSGPVASSESPEVNRIYKACLEVEVALDNQAIASEIKTLLEVLYKVDFSNDELLDGFDKVRKTLHETIQAHSVQVEKKNVSDLLSAINYVNDKYMAIKDNEIDLRGINWKEIGGIVDKNDAEKVAKIANFYNFPAVLASYQKVCVQIRNYTNFCFSVAQALLKVEKQIDGLVNWFNRTQAYFHYCVLDDINALRAIILEARKKGLNPYADIHGYPMGMVFINETDARTVMEKLSVETGKAIEADIAGLKTTYNNFTKQIGWGKQL